MFLFLYWRVFGARVVWYARYGTMPRGRVIKTDWREKFPEDSFYGRFRSFSSYKFVLYFSERQRRLY